MLQFLKQKKSKPIMTDFVSAKIVGDVNEELYIISDRLLLEERRMSLQEIVCDFDLISRLTPLESCYLAIQFVKQHQNCFHQKNFKSLHRYGTMRIKRIKAKGCIMVIQNMLTGEISEHQPGFLALNNDRVMEFDAADAFILGYWAAVYNLQYAPQKDAKKPYLKLVK